VSVLLRWVSTVAVSRHGGSGAAARAADIIATRWTPLVVWNVLLGCRTFDEIRRSLRQISTTMLTERLRMLERVGVHRARAASGRTDAGRLVGARLVAAFTVRHPAECAVAASW
jgi:hypothetical protein